MDLDLHKRLRQVVELGLLPTDDANVHLKKVVLTLVSLITIPAAVVWGSVYFLLGHPLSGSIPFFYAVILAASLAYYFKTKRTGSLQFNQLLLMLLLPYAMMWSLGGLSAGSGVMIWALFAPIAALIFLGKRAAIGWFLAYATLLAMSVLIDDVVAARAAPLSDLAIRVFYLLNIGCASAGLHLLVSYSVSEQKAVMEKLSYTNQLLAGHMNNTPLAAISWDRDFRVTRWNPAAERIFGYSREEALGRHAVELIVPPDADRKITEETMQASLLANGGMRSTNDNVTKSGQRIVCEWYTTPVADGNGNVVEVFSQAQDISRQEATQRALTESEARFKDLTATASDSVWEMDADLRFTSFSDGFEKAGKIDAQRLLGKRRWEFVDLATSGLSAEDWQAHRKDLVEHRFFRDFHYQARSDDGTIRHFSVSGKPVFDSDGNFRGYRGTGRDVTALAVAREDLVRAKEEAERANKAKSQFLSHMSHELRTPMNGILGFGQLLLAPLLADEDRQSYARIIVNSGQTLLTLLNDILDLSKIEAGKIEFEQRVFDPEHLIRETAALFSELAAGKGLAIETVWNGPRDARYRSDPVRLRQMLSNLVSNAVKFTPDGVVRIEACQVESCDGTVVLEFSVTDTGIGIPQHQQGVLFQPFSQVDASTTREYGGTGLGLSIVRQLATLMGGGIEVESQEGKGARFRFNIRAGMANEKDTRRQAERDHQPLPAPADEGLRRSGYVLVAEDNAVNQLVIEMMLEKCGVGCQIVENGQAVLEVLTSGASPALVLMDCEMPVMEALRPRKGYGSGSRKAAAPACPSSR